MAGTSKVDIASLQTESKDDLFGTGPSRGKKVKPKKKTVIKETPQDDVQVFAHISNTTTIHITRATNSELDAIFKLTGYKSKLEFAEMAMRNLLEIEKDKLREQGMDVDSFMKFLKQSNP